MGIGSLAAAQTGPELMLRPFPKEERIQAQGDFTMLNSGSTRNTDDFNLAFYDTSGRVRLFDAQRADPRIGWNYTDINTSGDPVLPSHLIDTSVSFGMGIADYNGWVAGIQLGIGYAGAGAFDDADAWYGMADILLGHEIDKTSTLGIVVDYDGNRSFMPDTPLPGFLYTKRLYPTLLLGVGFPYSSIEYKPNDAWTFTAKLYIPDDLTARIDYAVTQNFGIFGELSSRREAFHWDALPNGMDRLIYDSRRAEVGIRWTLQQSYSLTIAGGYAFSQEFNQGFDTRDQDRVAKPSDEPYARVGFEVRF